MFGVASIFRRLYIPLLFYFFGFVPDYIHAPLLFHVFVAASFHRSGSVSFCRFFVLQPFLGCLPSFIVWLLGQFFLRCYDFPAYFILALSLGVCTIVAS